MLIARALFTESSLEPKGFVAHNPAKGPEGFVFWGYQKDVDAFNDARISARDAFSYLTEEQYEGIEKLR